MLILFVLSCNPWTVCKMSAFIKLDITPLRNDQFVSFFFYNTQKRLLVKYMLDWTFEYHSFVFTNIINPGQLLFDSRCIVIKSRVCREEWVKQSRPWKWRKISPVAKQEQALSYLSSIEHKLFWKHTHDIIWHLAREIKLSSKSYFMTIWPDDFLEYSHQVL